jgi:hypothetical protein
MKLLPLSADFEYESAPEAFDVDAERSDFITTTHRSLTARFRLYAHETDTVEEIELVSSSVRRSRSQPSDKERSFISTQTAASLLHDHGLDLADFTDILGYALFGMKNASLMPKDIPDQLRLETAVERMRVKLGAPV